MAYDEFLADRIRNSFRERKVTAEEKKMMGGLCFLVNDKMCCGLVKNALMARIDPSVHDAALKKKGCREMDFTGRPMKGFVFVDPIGLDTEKELNDWIKLCLEYNPKAKKSRKK